MEQGRLKTKVTSNGFQMKWIVPKVEQGGVSPSYLFNSFDKFKIMLRLKIDSTCEHLKFFIQTKGTDGILPENLTMVLNINKSSTTFNFVPDTKWKEVYNCNKLKGIATICIHIPLPDTDISMLSTPETNFANLWKLPGADITIESAEGKSQKVHKIVLLAKSGVLRTMWKNELLGRNSNHLKIPELDKASLDLFIYYLYHGSIDHFNFKHCLIFLTIATKYNMNDLLVKCENFVYKNLTNDNVINAFIIADSRNIHNLKTGTARYIILNIAAIVLTACWRETNDAYIFKHIFEILKIRTTKQVTVVGQIEIRDISTRHCLTINFPVDIRQNMTGDHYMLVFPEKGTGHFQLRFSDKTMKLFIYQHQPYDSFCFTGVIIKNIKFNKSAPALSTSLCTIDPALSTSACTIDPAPSTSADYFRKINTWCLLASCQDQTCDYSPISLEISYDLKLIRNKSPFGELLMDLHSADMTLESSDGIRRQVHKLVLIARNMYKMVEECDSKHHVKLPNVSTVALDEFIKFVYTDDEGGLKMDSCVELLPISHIYNFKELKYQCEIKLKTAIDVSSAMRLLGLAVSTKSNFLEHYILEFLFQNLSDIIKTKDWLNCNDSEALKKIIEHYVNIQESLLTYRSTSAT